LQEHQNVPLSLILTDCTIPGRSPPADQPEKFMNPSSCLLLSAVLPFLTASTPEQAVRTWTDPNGKYRAEASFLELKDGKVHLRRADGRAVAVPFERLGKEDQDHVCLSPIRLRDLPAVRSRFDYKDALLGRQKTVGFDVSSMVINGSTLRINGGDARRPGKPFVFEWGDGTTSEGGFPGVHTYRHRGRNYIIRVTARYDDGTTDSAETLVRFVPPRCSPRRLPDEVAVTIPPQAVELKPLPGFGLSPNLRPFDPSHFGLVPRDVVEYVLTAAAVVQMDLANGNVCLQNGQFKQCVLSAKGFGGMYTLWFTTPAGFAVGGYVRSFDCPPYSSFFHEMGHNVTLNHPKQCRFGGNTDGPASMIYSETMAQIFQHATAYELVNNAEYYGLDDSLVFNIRQDAGATMRVPTASFQDYRKSGCPFSSWNRPQGPGNAGATFMVVAYKFCEHAEKAGRGYRVPLKRMMALLGTFNQDLLRKWDPQHDTADADKFRSTLLVAALSHAFTEDLRPEFRGLRFPVDDDVFAQLLRRVGGNALEQ
jgi:hypothetical protein